MNKAVDALKGGMAGPVAIPPQVMPTSFTGLPPCKYSWPILLSVTP